MSNFGEQINLIIDNLSKKLGVATDKIYPVLMKQVQVDFIWCIIWVIISIVLAIISFRLLNKGWSNRKVSIEEYKHNHYGFNGYSWGFESEGFIVVGIITVIIALIIFLVNGYNITQIIINPDYYIFSNYIQPLINR